MKSSNLLPEEVALPSIPAADHRHFLQSLTTAASSEDAHMVKTRVFVVLSHATVPENQQKSLTFYF